MAVLLSNIYSPLAVFFFLLIVGVVSAKSHQSSRLLQPGVVLGKEKMSHLHFYFHDVISGPNPTAIRVAPTESTNKSQTLFGVTYVFDDPLTEGPDPKSKMVGRAQGLYASASQEDVGLLMNMNFAFSDGKYKGSTLSILGRNEALSKLKEMPVLGGTGLFRFARGYAQAQTVVLNLTTGDAIVEYNLYVIHY